MTRALVITLLCVASIGAFSLKADDAGFNDIAATMPIAPETGEGEMAADSTDFDSRQDTVVKRNRATMHYYNRRMTIKRKGEALRLRLNEPFDTTRDDKYWIRALKHLKLDLNDKTVKYPKFLNFCVKMYRWGDKAFNSYDTAYVRPTGKNWKFFLKNDNWIDTYTGHLSDERFHIAMNSNMSSGVGFQLSFMAVGFSYMFDLDNIFGGDPARHYKWDFSFTCSRLTLEAQHTYNIGNVNIHRFGKYNDGKRITDLKFDGLLRESTSLDLYYFFNHRKYSQAAAYCYSKKQIRSAGSFIAGLLMSEQDIYFDFDYLDNEEMKKFLPQNGTMSEFRFHYGEFNALVGYTYNWVFHKNWLFNITAAPSFGWKHSYDTSVEGKKNMFSFNYRGRLALVRNAGNFFYALNTLFDGHLYHSKKHSFFNSIIELRLAAGIRF